MKKPIRKGMLLSAGLGTRLLPITEQLPKPIVPLLNVPNVVYNIELLRRAGIRDIVLNLHHLGSLIEQTLGDGSRWDVKLSYSRESTLLGTGGGVKNAEPFFNGEDFILGNCDFISDVHLGAFIERHRAHDSLATMILFQDEKRQPLYSKVGVDAKGHLCSMPKLETKKPAKTGIFTGLHILNAETLRFLVNEPCGINDKLYPILMQQFPQRVYGEFMSGFWLDTGELDTLYATTFELMDRLMNPASPFRFIFEELSGYEEFQRGIWISPSAEVSADAKLQSPCIIGDRVQIEAGAKVGPYTLIGDDIVVHSKQELRHSIVFGGSPLKESLYDRKLMYRGKELNWASPKKK